MFLSYFWQTGAFGQLEAPHEYVCYHHFIAVGKFSLTHYHIWSFFSFVLCIWMSQLHVLNCATNFVPSTYVMKMSLSVCLHWRSLVQQQRNKAVHLLHFYTLYHFISLFLSLSSLLSSFPSLVCFVLYFLSPLFSLFLKSSNSVLFTSFPLISLCNILLPLHFLLPLLLHVSFPFSLCISQVCTSQTCSIRNEEWNP